MSLLPLAHCTLEVGFPITSVPVEPMTLNESPLMVMLCAVLQSVVSEPKFKFQKV